MGIKILNGGFLTTMQDMGRHGFQESGMSVSGVMDTRSAALANILVGNSDIKEAVIEVTIMGPMIELTEDNVIAVTGGDLGAKAFRKAHSRYQAVQVQKGESITLRRHVLRKPRLRGLRRRSGCPVVMGSKSTNLKSKVGGFQGRKLGAGDEIGFSAAADTCFRIWV